MPKAQTAITVNNDISELVPRAEDSVVEIEDVVEVDETVVEVVEAVVEDVEIVIGGSVCSSPFSQALIPS